MKKAIVENGYVKLVNEIKEGDTLLDLTASYVYLSASDEETNIVETGEKILSNLVYPIVGIGKVKKI